MAEQVSRVVLVFHAHAVVVNTQVRIKADNAQGAKPHVHGKHVVREGKLVQRQVVIITGSPVHHVTAQINAQPVVIEAKMSAVAGVARILHARIIFFFLDLYKLPVKRLWRCRRVGLIIDAGVQHKVHGVRIATHVYAAVNSRPNSIAKGFSPTIVDTAHHASSKGYTGRTSAARILGSERIHPEMPRNHRTASIIVIQQGVAFRLHEVLLEICIPAGVRKGLGHVSCGQAVVLEQERCRFQKLQITMMVWSKYRRSRPSQRNSRRQ